MALICLRLEIGNGLMENKCILVINVGSSSIKLSYFNEYGKRLDQHIKGMSAGESFLSHFHKAIEAMDIASIDLIAHRYVHGGEKYWQTIKLTESVIIDLKQTVPLAPLHNGPALEIIKGCIPFNVPQYAVFDTHFHHTLPPVAKHYAIPDKYKIKRYGFHGIAHAYNYTSIAEARSAPKKLISVHLGSGCSVTAIENGQSIDTTMGFTPSEGLIMGTRAGDIDSSVIFYLAKEHQMSLEDISEMLNKNAGLLGLSELTADVHVLEKYYTSNEKAKFAIDTFSYRASKVIGSYIAVLGGVDAIAFSGGIGEHSAFIRDKILRHFIWYGIKFHSEHITSNAPLTKFHDPSSTVELYIVSSDENLQIAKEFL